MYGIRTHLGCSLTRRFSHSPLVAFLQGRELREAVRIIKLFVALARFLLLVCQLLFAYFGAIKTPDTKAPIFFPLL